MKNRPAAALVAALFGGMSVLPSPAALAATQTVPVPELPAVGTRLIPGGSVQPVQLRGVSIDPAEPLRFDFLITPGAGAPAETELRAESEKLIKYFLAALAVPEDEMWVNLSPYESDRIIPPALGRTLMGRDMLAQDYLLKQLTASLIYPEDELGERFWDRVLRRAQQEFGTTAVPLDSFNKVWIVPERAAVQVHGQAVFVTECRLKVMLEEDYLALAHHHGERPGDPQTAEDVTAPVVRDILLPEIEAEVNNGAIFSELRQIFHAVILAAWYKQNLKESLLGQAYADRRAVSGIDDNDPAVNQEIYERYVAALRQGVFDYIREDFDPVTRQTLPRRYVSGGVDARVDVRTDEAVLSRRDFLRDLGGLLVVSAAMVAGVPAFGQDDAPGSRLVAPGVQDRAQPLRWGDRSVMLGEQQPGIAYYHSPTNTYVNLLDETEGGQGEAARIAAAGFRVIKVYTTDRDNILELERVSQRIFEQYGLRTIAILSPQINGTILDTSQRTLWDTVNFYVDHLGKHPWIGIQLGNEDHYYLRGELLAGDGGIPLTKAVYYARYDQIAGAIRARLRQTAEFTERDKPILLGQGVRIGHRDGWRQELDETVGFVRGMNNITGLAVNAYFEPAPLYGPALQYLRQQTGMTVVVGEFGRSRRHLTPALQQTFNQQAWSAIREAMRGGHAAGGILFSWTDKVAGDEAAGASANFRLYDREFGIGYDGTSAYYEQTVAPVSTIPRDQFNTSDDMFWRAVHNPRLNRDYLVWYTQSLQGRAAEQQREKTELIRRAAAAGRLLTDDEVNHFHDLNFVGEGLYQLAVTALYDGNIDEVERLYDQLYVYYSGAQMYYGPRNFWVPFRNLTAQMELIRDTTADEALRERLRLIIGARPTNNRPRTYQDIRPDNAVFVSENPGGIDFHPGNMDLTTEGHGIQFPVPAVNPVVPIEDLCPVILNIAPVTSLPLLLGEKETPQPKVSRISADFFRSRAFRAAE